MAEDYKSYRIRTKVGQDAPNVVNVHLDQTYDEFQILSLKIDQKNSYNLYQSDKGIVVGRVLANGGVGVSNAKISVFIETDDTMPMDKRILYPYLSVNDTNNDRVRYNLLPDYVDEECHQNVGTFPNKRYVLDNNDVIEIFDRFWKYTTVTNTAGDYMLYGIPTGNHTLHMDVDLSDIGLLSQRPTDMVYKGYNINQFESPTKFKKDTNLNSLAQIKSQDVGVFVYPFWGDSTDNPDNIAVTRCDIQVDYKFEPTCIFIGSIITDTGSNAIGKNCAGTENVGKMSDLVSGEGSIEMIRKTIDNKVEEFQIKGNRVIDGDGVWCYQIPMNLDYVMTDEFGNLVPTDNPDKGIPTRARVRFRISLDDPPSDNTARKRCKYLVPNNPRLDAERFPVFTADEVHEPDYEFGTNTREESYCDLFWNKVYSVKNYIPRIQKNTKITNRKHTGIKLINHYGDNNPMPYNNLSIKLSFTYRFICVLTKIFIKLVGFLNNLITLLGMIPCLLAQFFRQIANLFNAMRIRIRAFGKTLINVCLGCPIGAVFDGIADIFEMMTPSCIAISSEFCSGDVTHAYTFYPGCGMFLGLTFGLLKCVWNKTKDAHNDHQINGEVNPEDRTTAINKSAELYNCVESQLAEDNDATSFNFQNDWINGTLYSPLWFRKITPKRSFLFGLFKRRAKDEWCSADHVYNGLVRIFHPCAVFRKGTIPYANHDGEQQTAHFMNGDINCGDDCHEEKTIIGLNTGLIRTRQTMLGQTVYYYKPVEYDLGLGELKLLFATDIILLGSLNNCDLNGVPQFFKSLESTTYKLPQNMLFTDNVVEPRINEDGTISNILDQVSTSEMTGNDWGNSNDDMCGEPDGGLFYGIGCSTIEVMPKSCINLSRICEFGVALDETKEVPNIAAVESSGDNAFETLVPDGFISKDELYNDNERSMFATLNGNELRTKLNTDNGLKEYDFRHIYVDNFDKSLYDAMSSRQRRCSGITYQYNYNLEDFSPGYYDFRMGKKPYFYDSNFTLPRYENSFYFYFGLKVGKTAIDKFNSQFFAECYNSEEAVSPIGIETKANSWCTDGIDGQQDGFVKIDLSNVSLPCDIIIQDNNSPAEFNLKDVNDDKIIIANSSVVAEQGNDYVQKCMESICALDNGYYTMTVTDNDGEILSIDFDLSFPLLRYNLETTNFKRPDNVLLATHNNSREEIAKDKEKVGEVVDAAHDYTYSRLIGGTIAIYNIIDGLKGEEINSYRIIIESLNDIDGFNGKFIIELDKGGTSPYWLNEDKANPTNPYIFGIPKGDERYKVTVVELCDGRVTNNKFTQTVMVKDSTPYKLYINDVIDYDVISDWGTGFTLRDDASTSSNRVSINNFELTKFSDNWLHISDYDNGRYKWDELLSYKKSIENINKAVESAKSVDTGFPISTQSGILTDIQLNGIIENLKTSYPDTYNGEVKAERDIIISECDNILTLKQEFISEMKAAFWLTCPEEYKTITFRATTDDMPVAFFVAHRSEKVDENNTNRNILEFSEKNKLTYYFNETDRIEDIMIPSLSTKDSERFGGGVTVNGNVTCALDNASGYPKDNRAKYAFFVGVINSSSQTNDNVPNGETIPVKVTNLPKTSELFGFHILDKIMDIKYVAWANMNGIPYYRPSDTLKNGKKVSINGLFAGKIFNGVTVNQEFTESKVGSYEMQIETLNGEDDMPTERYICDTKNAPLDNKDFEEYYVNPSSEYKNQYVPLLPVSSTMKLKDHSNCDLSEEIYGGLTITLEEESVNNCINISESKFNLSFENGPDEVMYFVYNLSPSNKQQNYPINEINMVNSSITGDKMQTPIYYNDKFDADYNYKLFGFNTDVETLIRLTNTDLVSEVIDENGNVVSVNDYFKLDDSHYNNSDGKTTFGISNTGEFIGGTLRGEFFVVARTNNECRAISPVYMFLNVEAGFVLGIVKTRIEETTDSSPEPESENGEGDSGNETTTSTFKDSEEYVVGFYIPNAKDLYYLNYFSYNLNGVCKIDELHKVEVDGNVNAQNGLTTISPIFAGITESMYELIDAYFSSDFTKYMVGRLCTLTVTDITGLKHICARANTDNIYKDEWYGAIYRPEGGYWLNSSNPDSGEYDTSDKTQYWSSKTVEEYDICVPFGEPLPTPEMIDEGYSFVGWYDAEDTTKAIIPCGTNLPNTKSRIFIAKWLTPIAIIWLADDDNQGHFSDGTVSYTQDLTDTEIGVPQSCPKGEPINDQGWEFDGWECVSECDGVTIDTDGKVTTDHSCTVKAKWIKKFIVRWIDESDEPEPPTGKVNVTFNVSTNNGKWSDDNSTANYTMQVDKNSSVTCDKIAINQQPLIYGFVGWNTDSTSSDGTSTFSVAESNITVYAIFKAKDCQVFLNDVSTSSDNITLEVETLSAASGTHFEWSNFTGEVHQTMVDGQGIIDLNGITDASVLRFYISDPIFYKLNGNSYFANIFKNNEWHIEEYNAKLQGYNICYTK